MTAAATATTATVEAATITRGFCRFARVSKLSPAPEPRSEATARRARNLCIDVTKFKLSISNRRVSSCRSLSQPRHLLRLLVLHSCAAERQRIAVAAVARVLLPTQSWKRSRKFIASLI